MRGGGDFTAFAALSTRGEPPERRGDFIVVKYAARWIGKSQSIADGGGVSHYEQVICAARLAPNQIRNCAVGISGGRLTKEAPPMRIALPYLLFTASQCTPYVLVVVVGKARREKTFTPPNVRFLAAGGPLPSPPPDIPLPSNSSNAKLVRVVFNCAHSSLA